VQIFNKSLTEHRNADTLKKLNECEKTIKEQREQAYINMDLSNEEKVCALQSVCVCVCVPRVGVNNGWKALVPALAACCPQPSTCLAGCRKEAMKC